MADEKKYKITRGNYTIKRTHKSLSDATIYERDYMATTNLGSFNGSVFPNEERGFKMVHANNAIVGRIHTYGEYEEPVTLRTLEKKNEESSESRLELSGKHTSLLDFVYYGNCVDFLQASIQNIILNFPGEIYFTGKKALEISGETWYYVENPFNINIWDVAAPKETDVNELRYFALKGQNYFLYDIDDTERGCMGRDWTWTSDVNSDFKPCEGEYSHAITIEVTQSSKSVEIRRYYLGGKFVLLHKGLNFIGYYARPSKEYIDEAFNGLEEFEKSLMNRASSPLYTIELDFPFETERGIQTYRRKFTWPLSIYDCFTVVGERETVPSGVGFKGETWIVEDASGYTSTWTWNGKDKWEENSKRSNYSHYYNIDISSERYQNYVKDLLKLCTFYDENYTDNLWRNLTHDAIKNLDNTFIHEVSDVDKEEIKENVENVHKYLNACARQFDEIKRYADGIKHVNKITYDGDTNLPDYCLTDVLNLSGWEISNSLDSLNTAGVEVSGLFDGEMNRIYDSNDVNVQFLKNLKLNSREILSRKGTKCGIETILGLFGMKSKDFAKTISPEEDWDFSIDEYVSVVTPKENPVTVENELRVEKFGLMRKPYSETVGEGYDPEPTDGLPVKIVEFEKNGIRYKCMMPWFKAKSINNMPYKYDGGIYFQMFGGWEGSETEGVYVETMNYLGVVEKQTDLTYVPVSELHGDDIFYVVNEDAYYELINKDYVYSVEDGWQKLNLSDPEVKQKIDYLISIIDTESGNNPHTGFGHYDNGAEFYKYLIEIFKDAIDNYDFIDDAYSCSTGVLDTGITNCGFNIEQVRDNVKCWYFADDTSMPNNAENGSVSNDFEGLYDCDSTFKPYDFKNGIKTTALTEYSPNSIVNDKNMVITFKVPTEIIQNEIGTDDTPYYDGVWENKEYEQSDGIIPFVYYESTTPEEVGYYYLTVSETSGEPTMCGDWIKMSSIEEYMKYVTADIMPYVKQMIPSTAIYKVLFEV